MKNVKVGEGLPLGRVIIGHIGKTQRNNGLSFIYTQNKS